MLVYKRNESKLKIDELKIALEYNPDSGDFVWKSRLSNRIKIGSIAGSVISNGYMSIRLYGKKYLAHRLAVFYMSGKWPDGDVDHINHIRTDNSYRNLRVSTRKENCRNQMLCDRNKSGFVGVSWNKNAQKWISQIRVNYEVIYLGIFSDKKDAIDARRLANIRYGFHKNHGVSV